MKQCPRIIMNKSLIGTDLIYTDCAVKNRVRGAKFCPVISVMFYG